MPLSVPLSDMSDLVMTLTLRLLVAQHTFCSREKAVGSDAFPNLATLPSEIYASCV